MCPDEDCRLTMRASNLVRHVKTKHPNVSQEAITAALHDGEDQGQQHREVRRELEEVGCKLAQK